MPSWDSFFAAQVGASAALTGLLFVGISINMSKIIAVPSLPPRAMKSLALLVTVLILSSVQLIPGESDLDLGIVLFVVAISATYVVFRLSATVFRLSPTEYRQVALYEFVLVAVVAVLLLAAAGTAFVGGSMSSYLLVAGMLLAILIAILDSWVLLVEVNR